MPRPVDTGQRIECDRAVMTLAMSVVLSEAAALTLKTERRDKRTVYIESRPCQAIPSKWYENFPGCRAMTMYMPRSEFADFLLYVPENEQIVYVVPRGKIAHDTSWAESALEPYKGAFHLLKESSPGMFERRVVSLSKQVQKIMAEAERHKLPYELIRTKRGEKRNGDYRTYAQRRIVVNGKRCAIFSANNIARETSCEIVLFGVPKGDWAEFLLYIHEDDVYVVPREWMPHETSLSLNSSRIFDYRNAWCVLEGVEPTSWKEIREYRKRFEGEMNR